MAQIDAAEVAPSRSVSLHVPSMRMHNFGKMNGQSGSCLNEQVGGGVSGA